MLTKLLSTTQSAGPLLARLALAIVIFPHGAQKAFGWFGGGGFHATMNGFASLGIPAPLAFLAVVAEFPGTLALASGFLTRIAAFGILCNMTVAAILVSGPHGFWMNWYGKQQGEGYEFHLLAIGLALSLIIQGGGALSVDRLLVKRFGPNS